MTKLTNRKQAAIEAVARHFSATWKNGNEDSPDAYLTMAGKRIAVEITVMKKIPEPDGLSKPRLRFDRVALGLVERLRAALREFVPDRQTVILSITAPIKLPSKTAAALEAKIRANLARRAPQLEIKDTIHRNQIRVCLVKNVSRQTSKVVGFVHNPDSDPEVPLRLTQSLLQHISVAANKRPSKKFTGEQWFVIANEEGLSHVETYRHVYSQLCIPTDFKKILIVLAGGRVETLSG